MPTYEASNDVGSLTIDLDNFFTDPDGDDLIYNVQFFGYPEGLVSPSVNDNILTLTFSGAIGDGFVEIQVSDGECENGNGFEVRITQEVSEGLSLIHI